MRVMVYLAVLAVLAVSAVADTGSVSSPLTDAKRLVDQGKCKQAIPILDKIAASDPSSAPEAFQMMGDCYKRLRNWSKAIECFERLLADYPDSVAPDSDPLLAEKARRKPR